MLFMYSFADVLPAMVPPFLGTEKKENEAVNPGSAASSGPVHLYWYRWIGPEL